MIETLILRTRPTTVEAKRFTADVDAEELSRWVGGWTHGKDAIRWFDRDTGKVTEARLGDWIVKTAFGHYKPQGDASIFSAYDRVTAAVSE